MSQLQEDADLPGRVRRLLFGTPRDLRDRRIFHRIALAPLLAWVGLGADGLSSSSYGPDEAFRTLGEHTYLAVGLALLTATTVIVIAMAYSRIIEHFPQGGGGYVVATSLLGQRLGVVSGCALLVDYVLTITVSIAAAGDALFSFLPPAWHGGKVFLEFVVIAILVVLNIRGLRESVLVLAPIFFLFAITHLIAIVGGTLGRLPELGATAQAAQSGFQSGLATLGVGGMLLLFLHAYSLGGGTYTGLEAVSNGLTIMREPRVRNGKRTMFYMAASLAFTAGGLLLLYLLWHVRPEPGKTLNAVLLQRMTADIPGGAVFALLTILSEGALLIVGAQTGFAGGPRVLASMANDSCMPHRFGALSERLTAENGVLMMGIASIAALLHSRGDVRMLVVLYSINVFVTFSLSMFGMLRRTLRDRREHDRLRQLVLFGTGFLLCVTILIVTTVEKFAEGAWLTLIVTGALVLFSFRIRAHYQTVIAKLKELYLQLEDLPKFANKTAGQPDPGQPTAAILVSSYGGLGIHTLMNIFRMFPGHFKNVVLLSVGVLDSHELSSEPSVDAVRGRTQAMLDRYVELARGLGIPATARVGVGTDIIDESEKLCLAVAKKFPIITFFAGKVIFKRERWYQPLLHNEVGFALQKRLHWAGLAMMVLPAKVK